MPLAPLPPSNTKRYWILYNVGSELHRFQIRCVASATDADFIAGVGPLWSSVNPQRGDNVVTIGAEVAAVGSDIRNPVVGYPTSAGSAGTNTTGQDRAFTNAMRGRSTTGRKVKHLFFGLVVAKNPDFLYSPAPAEDIANFITVAQGSTAFFLTIDGSKPVYRTNLSQDYNDHWENVIRP